MTAYPQPPLLTREGERGHSKIRRMRMGKLVDQQEQTTTERHEDHRQKGH